MPSTLPTINALEGRNEVFEQLAAEDLTDFVEDFDVLTKDKADDEIDEALEDVLDELFN